MLDSRPLKNHFPLQNDSFIQRNFLMSQEKGQEDIN